jgi:two-component system chemotaxis sensor kinase CheA
MNDMDASLLQDFLTESGELIEQLDQDLVTLESADAGEQPDICNACFRALHTIKGAAGFLGIDNIIEFAHAAEDALNKLRKGEVEVTASVMDLLLNSADVVRGQIDQLGTGEDPDAADPSLIQQLHDVAEGKHNTPESPAPPAHADAEERSDEASGPSEDTLPGTPLDLGPQKMDLIEFMAADLKDYAAQLDEAIAGLTNDASRAEAAQQLTEIADNLNKTADFFELDDLTALTTALLDAGPKLDALDHALLPEAVVRIRAIRRLIHDQGEALEATRALTWPITTLVQRLADVADGHALDDIPADHAGDPDAVLRIDGVLEDAEQGIAGRIEAQTDAGRDLPIAADAPAPPFAADASPPPAPEASEPPDRRETPDRRQAEDRRKAATSAAPEQTIRVEVGRLEELLNLVGQLVLSKNRVNSISRDFRELAGVDTEEGERIAEAASDLDRITGELQVGVMRTRMQPLAKLFDRYPRVIRDIARATDKQIALEMHGKDTEVDKTVLESLANPLVHILRNSADHGIESPDDREAAGKAKQGTITLTAEHQGSHVRVAIRDNGKGLHRGVIAGKAIEKGLTTPDQVDKLADHEVFRFIFEAGFSTAAQVSDLSGRGVGMDVVRTNIAKLNGTINIDSAAGVGTTIEILIPLTVAIMPAMVIESEGEPYAIPLGTILEIVRPEAAAISSVQGKRVVRIRDAVLPLVDLRDRLGQPAQDPHDRFAVVVKVGGHLAGLVVDRLVGQQEIVIKPLDDDYTQGGPFSGATIREDGRVCLILDINEVLKDREEPLRHAA